MADPDPLRRRLAAITGGVVTGEALIYAAALALHARNLIASHRR
jgi:hypothetical protein